MRYLFFLFFLSFSVLGYSQSKFNTTAEEIDIVTKMPKGWIFSFNKQQKDAYAVKLDSLEIREGKYALSIENIGKQFEFGVIDFPLSQTFAGNEIEFRGYIKTKNVNTGTASLWLRIDGKNGTLAFDNTSNAELRGTTDWKEYTIKLPYDQTRAETIHIGGMLTGDGKAWFDDFKLFIDGKPIEQVTLKQALSKKADLDTAFKTSSGISSIILTPRTITNLTIAGQFWGFLKYHHPDIAKGNYNWDAELFRFLPAVIYAKNNIELSKVLELYLDQLLWPKSTKIEGNVTENTIALKPNYGHLFDGSLLSLSLTNKLLQIKDCVKEEENYYVTFSQGPGNPKFQNERSYNDKVYPDLGYRLLSLYRYWSIINYFFPYKDLIGTDWNEELAAALPDFINSRNAEEYTLCVLKLIAKVHDTHANIWNSNKILNQIKGNRRAPFEAKFVQNKLVVTGYYIDSLDVKSKFQIGDVILSINGKTIKQLTKEYLPLTPASNYETQLRDLPSAYLLRGNGKSFLITSQREDKVLSQTIPTISLRASNLIAEKTGYRLINKEIGYIFPEKYKNTDLPTIKKLFRDTKGIIIDMRCYPSDFMPFEFGNYIKSTSTPFVKFSKTNVSHPGLFTYSAPISNGKMSTDNYKGKVIVIVNAETQSSAEYTTMAFQGTSSVKVIGSTTAGADGNISTFSLPGGISTAISGLGIFYPDNTKTQRVGVKIDRVIMPSIKGIVDGKDELLEEAQKMIKSPGVFTH